MTKRRVSSVLFASPALRFFPVRSAALGICLAFFATTGWGIDPQGPQAGQDIHAAAPALPGMVVLRGNTRPEATSTNDRGRVADSLRLDHMLLQLRRSPEQERALEQYIADIQDPASPQFHHWLTAAEIGQRFGVAPGDIARATSWLKSQGFIVNLVYPNQMVIDFSGSAGQVRRAFQTEIHHLMVNGEAHIANMSDPQIPAELAPIVKGVVSLHDFRPHSMVKPRVNYTPGDGSFPLVPGDIATIYNYGPVYAASHSGQGQTITIIQDTDLYSVDDWNTFRTTFGLASQYPDGSLTTVHPPSSPNNNCTDPGVAASDGEAAIDVEWSSASAPSAAIVLASCADSTTTFGGFLALANLVNSSTPPAIASISFGDSEPLAGATYLAFINGIYQQAVTESTSIFVSADDVGPAATDQAFGNSFARYGVTVNGEASTVYNVAVGGTDFADTYLNENSTYWSATNSSAFASAKSYIPETPWNSSCASQLIADFNGVWPPYGINGACNNALVGDVNIAAGGGGPSGCATGTPDGLGAVSGTCAGYPKPKWQSGFLGNPNDGVRDLPDVSLFAANGAWGHSYVACFSDPNNSGKSCSGVPSTWYLAGGTSFAAPVWAGIQALINQTTGSSWGNPNPTYYAIAAQEYGTTGNTSCESNQGNKVGTNCVFYDLTQIPLLYTAPAGTTGGSIDLPCWGLNCYSPEGINTNYLGVMSAAPETINGGAITGLGTGAWTAAPTCTLSGGGGSGAACSTSVTGVVGGLTLTAGGSGYTDSSKPITCTLTGGGGTGATCQAIASNGAIAAVLLSLFGSGYTSAPTCAIGGGGGTGATCTASYDAAGLSFSVTNGGSAYTTMPQCVLSGGSGGTGATCEVVATNSSNAYQPTFNTGVGYDLASGLGTVNVANLVNGFVASAPIVNLNPPSLTFSGQTENTTSSAQTVTLKNTGGATLSSLTIATSGDFAQSNTCNATVDAGAQCTISVTFTPTATGTRTGDLTLNDSAGNSPQQVSLTGQGLAATAPAVTFTPPSLTFSSQAVGTTSSAQSVTLTNTGPSGTLTVTAVGATGDFHETDNCAAASPIAVNSTCTISVTFAPTASGTRTGTLNVTDNGSGSPQSISLTGTAPTAPAVSLTPTSLTFSSQAVGTTSSAQSVTLTNAGPSGTLTVTTVSATGDFHETDNCAAASPIAVNSTCTISVTFAPTATGTRTGTLNVTDNGNGSLQSINLTGTATAPAVTLSSTSVNMGSALVGNAATGQSVTVTNSGTASLTVSSVQIAGTNASDFGETNTCNNPVAASGTCQINITFTPSSSGSRSATIGITDNASGSPHTITVSGTGEDYSFSLPSGSSATSTVAPGGTASYTLSVTAGGGLTGSVSFAAITGAPSETTCTASPNPAPLGTNVGINCVTTAPSAVAPRGRQLPPVSPLSPGIPWLLTLALVLVALAWAILGRKLPVTQRWRTAPVLLGAGLLLALALAACGGGSSGGGGGGGQTNPGTPAGTYTLTVTGTVTSGSQTVNHNYQLTLTVS